jgi:hypothetical protein
MPNLMHQIPDANFDNLCLFCDAQAEKFRNPKCYDSKDGETKHKMP